MAKFVVNIKYLRNNTRAYIVGDCSCFSASVRRFIVCGGVELSARDD